MAAVHMRIGIETIYQDDGAGTPFLAVKSRIGTIRKRVGACLWKLRDNGVAREIPIPGEYKGWELKKP